MLYHLHLSMIISIHSIKIVLIFWVHSCWRCCPMGKPSCYMFEKQRYAFIWIQELEKYGKDQIVSRKKEWQSRDLETLSCVTLMSCWVKLELVKKITTMVKLVVIYYHPLFIYRINFVLRRWWILKTYKELNIYSSEANWIKRNKGNKSLEGVCWNH